MFCLTHKAYVDHHQCCHHELFNCTQDMDLAQIKPHGPDPGWEGLHLPPRPKIHRKRKQSCNNEQASAGDEALRRAFRQAMPVQVLSDEEYGLPDDVSLVPGYRRQCAFDMGLQDPCLVSSDSDVDAQAASNYQRSPSY